MERMNPPRMLGSVVCLVMLGQALSAQPPELWRNWSNVAALQAGQQITVQIFQSRQKLKGTFLSSNDAGITIRTKGGEQVIAKENVYRVSKHRSIAPPLLVGAVSGAIVYAIVAPRRDFTTSGHFIYGAAFAGIGTLIGWVAGSVGRSKLIYQAPTP